MSNAISVPRLDAAASVGSRHYPLPYVLMLLPALLFLSAFFLVPAGMMFSFSLFTQSPNGDIGWPITLGHYLRLFSSPLYANVLLTTLRISVVTSICAIVLGYPVALMIARGSRAVSSIATIVIVAPLVVSVIVRTYGLMLLFANNNSGVLNWVLGRFGFGNGAVQIMYTEAAVVIGSLHVYLPMMVLPLASSLSRMNLSLEEAAQTLGANSFVTFFRVTVPLTLPGLAAGLTMVFSLTASSFVTPAILGGNNGLMLGNLLEQQVMAVYDWPFGSAIAVVMVLMTFAANGLSVWFIERRQKRRRRLSEV